MNELIETSAARRSLLARLFMSASLFVLSIASGKGAGAAESSDTPTVWIELGGQLERIQGTGDRFVAPFMALTPTPDPYRSASPVEAIKPPRYAVGGEGQISFEPLDMNWVFSAAVRYGRSNGNKVAKQQTDIPRIVYSRSGAAVGHFTTTAAQFVKTFAKHNESHAVLDFKAGKDVGMGSIFDGGNSTISLGVRYAQFQSRSDIKVYARPHVEIGNILLHVPGYVGPNGFPIFPEAYFHEYTLFAGSSRSLRGIGPSISWDASLPIAGGQDGIQFAFDVGLNAAILFARQKTTTHHKTIGAYYDGKYQQYISRYQFDTRKIRSHSLTIPNVGGRVAISMQFPNAKVSLGYRGDFFLGSVDAGIDARRNDTLRFHGPFASISIGFP